MRPLTLAEVGDKVKILELVLFGGGERAALAGRREGRSLGRELHVEVADVLFPSDGRDERGQELPLEETLPVDTLGDR